MSAGDITLDEVLVPDFLVGAAAGLLDRALETLDDAAELYRRWDQLESCVNRLRPHADDDTDDEIADAWNEMAGVRVALDVLQQIADVITDGTGFATGPARPRAETRESVHQWRRRFVR